jgi:hypothetical protein
LNRRWSACERTWLVKYEFADEEAEDGVPTKVAQLTSTDWSVEFAIELDSTNRNPGLNGRLVFAARAHA